MKIPNSTRKKALFIIDVQEAFLDERNVYIVNAIKHLLENTSYELYVEAIFSAEKGSMWDLQQNWNLPKGKATRTVEAIAEALRKRGAIKIEKSTRSIFKGSNKNLPKLLEEKGIEEIHIVGTQTNDCIFATALEASDLGYFTYVLEECCETANEDLQMQAIALLRRQNVTNHSVVEKISFLEV